MRLIPILHDGSAGIPAGTLNEFAMSVISSTLKVYEQCGYAEPWIGYLAVEDGVCVGACGFTKPPNRQMVEIAYFTFPEFEGRGVATRMAQQLVSIAQGRDPSVKIIAHTLPQENASTRVLKKTGFAMTGPVEHPEDGTIWEWRYEQTVKPV